MTAAAGCACPLLAAAGARLAKAGSAGRPRSPGANRCDTTGVDVATGQAAFMTMEQARLSCFTSLAPISCHVFMCFTQTALLTALWPTLYSHARLHYIRPWHQSEFTSMQRQLLARSTCYKPQSDLKGAGTDRRGTGWWEGARKRSGEAGSSEVQPRCSGVCMQGGLSSLTSHS